MSAGLAAAFSAPDPSIFEFELSGGDRRRLSELAGGGVAGTAFAAPPLQPQASGSVRRDSRTGSAVKSATGKIPPRVLAAKRKAEAAKANKGNSGLDASARDLAFEASQSANPWNTYANAATQQVEVARRRLQQATPMELVITTNEVYDSTSMSGIVAVAGNTDSLFVLVDPTGTAIQPEQSSMSVSVSAEAEVTQLATGNASSDGEAFDAVLSAALADTTALAAAVGVSSDSLEPSVLPLTVCTSGREIAGSDRTAFNPCPRVAFGETCDYSCTNGERASGPHVCLPSGEFSGGRCGRRPVALTGEQCPTSWEQLDLGLACDEQVTYATDYRQPSSARTEAELWARLQYWTDCNSNVALANILPLSCGVGGRETGDATTCRLGSLPIGEAEIEIQAWDSATESDATCRVTVHVVDEEAPVIPQASCPAVVTTRMGAGTTDGKRSSALQLVPTLVASDNSQHYTLTAVVNGKAVESEDFEGFGAGPHTVHIVATDDAGNQGVCRSVVGLW